MKIDSGFGLFNPLLINCSPLRVKSDKIKLIKEMFKKDLPNSALIQDYLIKSLLEWFLINKSEDSIEDLTNKEAISKLEINEFPP